jgi:hypothetical protein
MRRFLKAVSSSYLAAGLILCLAAWYFIFRRWGSFEGLWEPFNLKTFQVFYGILCLNVLLLSISSLFNYSEKRLRVLFPVVLLFMLLSGAYAYAHHFEGTIAIGEAESYNASPTQFRYLSMGPRTEMPTLDYFIIRSVEPSKQEGIAEMFKAEKIISFGKEGLMINGYDVRLLDTGPSLLFHLYIKSEKSTEEGYVKLDLDPPYEEDSFITENSFIIDIRRGKRSLYEGIIENSSKVEVEEVVLTLKNARKYAVLRISRYQGINIFLFSVGLFLLTAGAGAFMRFRPAREGKRSR